MILRRREMDVKFTPGPWEVGGSPPHGGDPLNIYCDDRTGSAVATVRFTPDITGRKTDERRANTHLIAAAPDLFEAARMAEEKLTGMCMEKATADEDPVIIVLRAALHKALGETP
jgi:hypothetical protein